MPLIQCPDCQAAMSTTAGKCQRCGSTTYQLKKLTPLIVIPAFLLVIFLLWTMAFM